MGFYLFVFYTDVVGLSAWLAGTVLMLVRLWDILSDQLIGWMSDHPWPSRTTDSLDVDQRFPSWPVNGLAVVCPTLC